MSDSTPLLASFLHSSSLPAVTSTPSSPCGIEDKEMEHLMRSSPIPSDDDEPPSESQPTLEGTQQDKVVSMTQQDTSRSNLSLPGVSCNEQTLLRCAADRLKIHPYQQDLLWEFVKCSSVAQDTHLQMAFFVIDNRLDEQAMAAPAFSLNIKSFIIAVLLSARLAAYKGSIPRDHVLSLIMRDRLHIPNTFDRDPHAAKVLKEQVNHELSQARGKLKKLIKSSDDKNIFDLATALVAGTLCSITIPLCGRVALFRKVFQVDSSDKFWDSVDDELVKIRKRSNNDSVKIAWYFKAILDTD